MEQFSDDPTDGGNMPLLSFVLRFSLLVIAITTLTAAASAQQMPDFANRVQYTLPVLENKVALPVSDQTQIDKSKDPQANTGQDGKQDSNNSTCCQPNPPNPDKEATKVNIITDSASVSSINYKPITNKQRWQLYLAQNFTTPGAYLGVIFSAGLDQMSNNPVEWGQGSQGYGRRFASRFGTNVVQGTIQSTGAWLLGEDPRYIRSDKKGFLPRAKHALIFGVLTYNNQGRTTVNIANISSYYAASLISTTWVPTHRSVIGYALNDGSSQLLYGSAFNLVQEFWPEIMHVFKH